MINIILGLLIIHTLSILIFKPKLDTLSCGIFAWAGKDPKEFNKGKLDILGIWNETRGTHSCGIAKDGDIVIGIDKNKVYRDFLTNCGYDTPRIFPIVIGHTRLSTYGAHTLDNAHPFGFGKNKDSYEFIGVHNGTLLNHIDLAETFDVKTKEEFPATRTTIAKSRYKIDSEVLLECIYKNKNYKVLNQYNGAAALVFTNTKEPNVVYCYHGASKKIYHDAEDNIVEERPLFFYQESKNSVYISSIKASLLAIGGGDKTVGAFEHNTVYKITNGNIETAKKVKITRAGRFQTGLDYSKVSKRKESKPTYEDLYNDDYYDAGLHRNKNNKQTKIPFHSNILNTPDKGLFNNNIYRDTPTKSVNAYGNQIYFNKLRYWRNGHTITGIYTWINTYGFYFLGETEKEADSRFFDIVNKLFYNGDFINKSTKSSRKEISKSFIPFPSTTKNEITEPLKFYMYNGVRIKTSIDYTACMDMNDNKSTAFDWSSLSHCSTHPVIDIDIKSKSYLNQSILLNDAPFSDTICPLGSDKVYKIVNGNCVKISTSDKESFTTIATLKIVTDNLNTIENNLIKNKKDNAVVILDAEDDRLEEDINEMFKDALRRFPGFVKRLSNYTDSEKGAQAQKILKNFLTNATKLITIEAKE